MGVEHLKDSAMTKANVTALLLLLLLDFTTGELHETLRALCNLHAV